MCIYNPLCQEKEELCNCKNDFASKMLSAMYPNNYYPYNSSIVLRSFIQTCQAQTETIKNIFSLTSEILDKISAKPQRNVPALNMNVPNESHSSTSRTELMNLLCEGKTNQMLSLKLEHDIPSPIYKDRFFKLEAKIVDTSGQIIELSSRILVQLLLYTKDSPPKQLILTTTGEKIMKGNTEIEGKSLFVFNKIAIQNVTSHYLSGALYLVVMPDNYNLVKPLIIEDVVVKARKMKEDFPMKKLKSEDAFD
ncbi:hypothetical protein SteCoe_12619 [Stentor coeruleus]|uniref:Uncharacterized protein n=1 Tax=Stentor coeruleus TaxID=5963 RepID=A0A1R2CAF4_9CILI|nr:hypothetical protein SteCoe_12619 [Stentor coeruleus]